MLAYYYLSGGYAAINGKPVHGVGTGMPPTHFSHKEYLLNKNVLIQAPFTAEYIERKYNKPDFPYKAYFTLDMIRNIDYRNLQKIATYFEIDGLLKYINLIYAIRNTIKDL